MEQRRNNNSLQGIRNMKNLNSLYNLYNTPWAIMPSTLDTMKYQVDAILSGKMQMPLDDEEDEDDMPMMIQGNTSVINVSGVIGKKLGLIERFFGGVDVDDIAAQLELSVEDPSISTIVMAFDTPGGSVVGTPELANLIKEVSTKKRCIGFTDTLCASAGIWLASQCNAFYCSPSATVGSVGVYSIYIDQTRMLEDMGIKVNAISAGKYKLTGSPFKPMSDEERTMLQADVDKIYNEFKATVSSNKSIADEDMQGQCFDGIVSVEKGFADGNVNNFNELLKLISNLD